MMHVLLTGGSGFIGRHLAAALQKSGAQVHLLLRRAAPDISLPQTIVPSPWTAQALYKALSPQRFDILFHLAASGAVNKQTASAELIDINCAMTTALMEAVADQPLRAVIMTGSCAEYAASDMPLREDMPLTSTDPYGQSKSLSGARLLASASARHLPAAFVRLFNVYGPGENAARLLPSLMRALQQHAPIALTAGFQRRDFLHVDDAVGALLAAQDHLLEQAPRQPLILNACTNVGTSVREFASTVNALMKSDPLLLQFGALPMRPGEHDQVVGDASRMRDLLDWQAKVGIADGLAPIITF
jgi:nucleoside-diphosphate-sugar epimerase